MPAFLLSLIVQLHAPRRLVRPNLLTPWLLPAVDPPAQRRGQATTEYALVLLAAALVGLLVVAWATSGGGAERVGRLFNRVLDNAIERV